QTPDQWAGDSGPARRRHVAWFRRENPWRPAPAGIGGDELRICKVFWRRAVHRLRGPALRLHDRRCDPVSACRHGRGWLEDTRSSPGCLEGAAGPPFSELRIRVVGGPGGGGADGSRRRAVGEI